MKIPLSLPIQNDRRLNLIRLLQEQGFVVQAPWQFDKPDHGFYPPTIVSKGDLVISCREVEEGNKTSHFRFVNCRAKISRDMSNQQIVDALVGSAAMREKLPALFQQFSKDVFALFNKTGNDIVMEYSDAQAMQVVCKIGKYVICRLSADGRQNTDKMFTVSFPEIVWHDQKKKPWSESDDDDTEVDADDEAPAPKRRRPGNVYGLRIAVDSPEEILKKLDEMRPMFLARPRMFEQGDMATVCHPGFFADAIIRYGIAGISEKQTESYRTSPCPYTNGMIDLETEKHTIFAIRFNQTPEIL
jgi:hypothetical protein